MGHIYLISRNFDDIFINLEKQETLAYENSYKDSLHFGIAMKGEDHEDFMRAIQIFDQRRCLVNTSKSITSNLSAYNPISIDSQTNKQKPLEIKPKIMLCLCVFGGMQQEGIDFCENISNEFQI